MNVIYVRLNEESVDLYLKYIDEFKSYQRKADKCKDKFFKELAKLQPELSTEQDISIIGKYYDDTGIVVAVIKNDKNDDVPEFIKKLLAKLEGESDNNKSKLH